jgi:predicted nucleotidyltransferase
MNYPTVFDLIAVEFEKAGVHYVLAGGFAVNAHHVTRQTLDVDLLIATDDLKKASDALQTAGYQKGLASPVVARFKGDGKLLLDIDLMLIDPGTFQKILKQGQKLTIAGHPFMVLSLEHLIAMKCHAIKNDPESREPKDLLDIIQLVRRNGMDPAGSQLRKICEIYGTPELFQKIQLLTKGSP